MTKKTPIFFYLFLVTIFWVYLFRQGVSLSSREELTLASLIYFLCSIPFALYLVRGQKTIPFFSSFCFYFFIYFGYSIFASRGLFELADIDRETVLKSLNFILFGILSLLLAFYSPLGAIINKTVPQMQLPWDTKKAYRLGVYAIIIGLTVQYIHQTRSLSRLFGGVLGFLIDLSRMGIVTLYILHLQKKLKIRASFVLLSAFCLKVTLDLITGSSNLVVGDFLTIIFAHLYCFRRIPWTKIAICLFLIVVIFGARGSFREATWFSGEYASASPVKKASLYFIFIRERLLKQSQYYKTDYETLAARTDYLVTFCRVITETPLFVPYWNGHTYRTLYTTFIPRFLFPAKPQKTLGQEFGHRYSFLNPWDYSTSYNLPVFIEFYVNYGPIGIVGGMFILGLIFRVLYALFDHPNCGEGGAVISIVIMTGLINLESDFSLTFGNVLQYLLLLYFIIKMKVVQRVPIQKITPLRNK